MWCAQCKRDLLVCICADLQDRINILKGSEHVTLIYCHECKEPVYICKCKKQEAR